MNRLIHESVLLAQGGRLDSLTSGLRGRRTRYDTSDMVTGLVIVAGVIVVVWVLAYVVRRQQGRGGRARPLRLFLTLCKAHQLRWSESWLLWRVARAQRLRDPARLFVEPGRLDSGKVGRSLAARLAELGQIRRRLFGRLGQTRQRPQATPSPKPARIAASWSQATLPTDSAGPTVDATTSGGCPSWEG